MNSLPSDFQQYLKTHISELYEFHKRKEDAIHQANRIIETFSIGFSSSDYDERYLVLRFQCPTLMKGNGKTAELHSLHKIIRLVRELIFQIVRKYDTGQISEFFIDLDMMDLDTASFLYFLHENLSCVTLEKRLVPTLGELCVNTIRSFKRDKMYILPLKVMGSDSYNFFAVTYENYMRQQAYPHINFCSHPVHYFNYMYEVPYCLILDLHAMTSFQRILKMERRRAGNPSISLDIGFNEIDIVDNIDGIHANYCFMPYEQYCHALNENNPF